MVESQKKHHVPNVASREASHGIIQLTPRGIQVLQGVADGLTSQQIGERLGISPQTVKGYRTNIITASHDVGEETGYVKLIKAGIFNGNLVNIHPTKPFEPLSQTEQDVIQSLYDEKTREKTCEDLGIPNGTLKLYLKSIFSKYRVRNFYAAVAMHAGITMEQTR